MTIEDVREHVEWLLRANAARLHYSRTDCELGVCGGVTLTCDKILTFLAQAIEAGTDETRNAAQPEGRERGPKGAPK